MKDFFCSIAMTFSMFSVFPMPRVDWKPENMRWMLAQLPLVGAVIGLFLWFWGQVCSLLGFGLILSSAGYALLPVLLSGAIHMDGFCDTVDALASHGEPARKREILKDSHTGAFAVIYTAVYLLAFFALSCEISEKTGSTLIPALVQILSRCIGAFAGTVFPKSGTGLLAAFHDAAKKGSAAVLVLWMLVCIALTALLCIPLAVLWAVLTVLCLIFLYRMAVRNFGGMSGDLAGFIITLSQLILLAGYAAVLTGGI